jgi:hypothetical protein
MAGALMTFGLKGVGIRHPLCEAERGATTLEESENVLVSVALIVEQAHRFRSR